MKTGQITMITETEPGVVLNLAALRLDTNPPSNSLCIEVFTTKGYSYLIQFHNEAERERWANQLGTMAKSTKGSAQAGSQLSVPK
jgi:hypothetical protein